MYKSIKRDDRGLSLVELLVAVVILAMVAIPLGRSFITSARISARSEAMGDAAEAARNVAEAVVAMGMDDIYSIMEDKTTLLEWSVAEAATYKADGDPASNPMTSADPIYTFKLEDVTYAARQYDAVVTLRADPTKNDASIPQYTPMDAVFNQGAQSPEPDTEANAYFDVQAAALHGTVSNKQRTIALTLSSNETSFAANIAYNYTCTVTPVAGEPYSLDFSEYSVDVPKNIGDDGRTPAVYIMFYPYGLQDSFTVNSTSVVTFPVFLVAQQPQVGYNVIVTGSLGRAEMYANVPLNGDISNAGKVEIYASQNIDRLYDATVQIYEADGSDVVYTLDTTKMN